MRGGSFLFSPSGNYRNYSFYNHTGFSWQYSRQRNKMNPYIIPGLKSKAHKLKRIIKTDEVVNSITDYFKCDIQDLRAKNRNKKLVQIRYIMCYMLRKHTDMTLKDIAEYFAPAMTNHTTALHGINYIAGQLDAKFPNTTKEIFNEIYI
jgi:chromosomal replication initiation ATPase DnaA